MVSVIVVNYNGKKFLKDCFESLMNLNYPKSRLEIIMVDNGSTDGSIEFVKENFPKVKILKNDVNNYCRANNLGIKHSKGEYIAFLNNDTKVDKNWLIELIKVIERDKSIGGVGGKILFKDGKDGRIESTGHKALPNFYWTDRGSLEKDVGQYDILEEVDSLCGGAILYRKEVLKDVNYFDEDFNMYLEDVDISIRVKKEGWKLIYVPQSIVYHTHHGSAKDELPLFYTERNRLLLIAKHWPEKLGDALLGRGYFTVQRNIEAQGSLYTVLDEVVLKLIKHHKMEIVKEVLSVLFAELRKILYYENNLLKEKNENLIKSIENYQELTRAKDEYITNLNLEIAKRDEAIKAKDEHITNLNLEIAKRDEAIKAKDEHITNLNLEIAKRDEAIKAKDEHITNLNLEISKRDQAIRDIYNSTAFRYIVRPLWFVLGEIKQIIRKIIISFRKTTGQKDKKEFADYRINQINRNAIGICTIISKNYLAYARVLAESFLQYNRGDIFVLLTDKIDGYFDPTKEKFTLIEIENIKEKIKDFEQFCFQYNITELNTAVKPFFLEYLFEKYLLQKLIFFDPDILITHSLEDLFKLLDNYSIILTPHITQPFKDNYKPKEIEILRSGVYNLGFIALANTNTTQRLLKWWQERVLRYCKIDLEEGLFVDQKWIDLIPGFFEDVFILRDKGYNVAYWNLHYRKVYMKGEKILFGDNKPVHFFHFSGFNPDDINSISKHQNRFKLKELPYIKPIFELYRDKLIANGYNITKNWPCSFDYFDNGVKISECMRKIYWKLADELKDKLGNPFIATGKEKSYFKWLNEPIDKEIPIITNLMYEIYKMRLDVQKVYPEIFGKDRAGFVHWFLISGPKEYGLNKGFLNQVSSLNSKSQAITSIVLKMWFFSPLRQFLKWYLKKIIKNPRTLSQLKIKEINLTKKITDCSRKFIKREDNFVSVNNKKGVNVLGYITTESGVGEAVRSNIKCLKSIRLDFVLINITNHSWSRQNNFTFTQFSKDNPYYINLIHVNADMLPLLYSQKGTDWFKNKYNIGYWTWELSDFPDEWINSFTYCDEIWVPSSFVLNSIIKKSPIPVIKIPHAVEINNFKNVDRSYFGLKDDEFIFLFIFDFLSYFERKNPLAIIKAFKQAFSPSEKVRLLIKSINSNFDPISMSKMQELAKDAKITFIDRYLYKDEVNTLIFLCDAYISLHRSEGFGFTMAEAMFLGKPVIATGYSGNMDFMNENNSYLVKYKLVGIEKDVGPYKKGLVWAEPDISHATELMRFVYENKKISQKKGKIAAEDIRKNFSYKTVGDRIKSRIDYIYNNF